MGMNEDVVNEAIRSLRSVGFSQLADVINTLCWRHPLYVLDKHGECAECERVEEERMEHFSPAKIREIERFAHRNPGRPITIHPPGDLTADADALLEEVERLRREIEVNSI